MTLYTLHMALHFDFNQFKKLDFCFEESLPGTSLLLPIEVGTLAWHRAAGLQGSWKGKRCQAAPGCCHLPTAVCTESASFEIHHRRSGSTAVTKM